MERPVAMGEHSLNASLEVARELLQGLDATPNCAVIPLLPEPQGSTLGAVIPEVLQIVLEDVDGGQSLIGRQQLIEPDPVAFLRDVLTVPQQEPAGALNDLASRLVVPQ